LNRYYSLDVFRGATVALMILVNNPGSWGYIYSPLQHAKWHGCTATDLVFPFFLFAVGNAMAFVLPKLKADTKLFWIKVLKRTLLIFAIGLFLNWSPFIKWQDNEIVFKKWESIRLLGVLQRIALAYFFAMILCYFLKPKQIIAVSSIILLFYWSLLLFFGNNLDPFSLSGFWGTQIDITILGISHIYKGEGIPFDPEGLISSITPIIQVCIGYLVGNFIIQKGKSFEMLSKILIAGLALTMLGLLWDISFPINKKIWTSSYVLYTSGLAILTIGFMIYFIEFKNSKNFITQFFDVFGKNPLFIFVLSGFLPRVSAMFRWIQYTDENGKDHYTSFFPWFYETVCKPISPDLRNGSLLYAIIIILFYWSIAYYLNKKKIYIKV
jgi:predicted acyltransferase